MPEVTPRTKYFELKARSTRVGVAVITKAAATSGGLDVYRPPILARAGVSNRVLWSGRIR